MALILAILIVVLIFVAGIVPCVFLVIGIVKGKKSGEELAKSSKHFRMMYYLSFVFAILSVVLVALFWICWPFWLDTRITELF